MNRITFALAGILGSLALLLGIMPANAAPVAPSPTPSSTVLYVEPLAPAAPMAKISHDLAVKNDGDKTFFICSHWGASNGEKSGTSCSLNGSNTRYGVLQPGKWSDRVYPSWPHDDVDGIEVPVGYKLKESIPGPNRTQFKCQKSKNVWHKVSPTISDHHREFYLKKC